MAKSLQPVGRHSSLTTRTLIKNVVLPGKDLTCHKIVSRHLKKDPAICPADCEAFFKYLFSLGLSFLVGKQ